MWEHVRMKEECNTVWVFLATSNISRVIHVFNLALSVVYSLNDPCASIVPLQLFSVFGCLIVNSSIVPASSFWCIRVWWVQGLSPRCSFIAIISLLRIRGRPLDQYIIHWFVVSHVFLYLLSYRGARIIDAAALLDPVACPETSSPHWPVEIL